MNDDLKHLQPYPFEKLSELKQGITPPRSLNHIALSIGEPQHPSPHFVIESLIAHMHQLSKYPATKGVTELREAIAKWRWKKWFDEGRPVSIDSTPRQPATFTPRANPDLFCSLDYGVSHIDDPDVVFLDVRSDGEWEGTNDRGNRRAGRIPGAVHLEWLHLVTSDRHQTIKPADELRSMLEAVGATPDKEVVTY